jgi:prepilin-type N-terminal cleavage/methylation domain-containing protein
MKSRQAGFTLVEIAIVLVIIGLLLGGVLKGQELINSAKVKNFATDFRNIPLFIYGYQDKYKALPGDHHAVTTAVTGSTLATTPTLSGGNACTNPTGGSTCTGNGVIDGTWNTTTMLPTKPPCSGSMCVWLDWLPVRRQRAIPGTIRSMPTVAAWASKAVRRQPEVLTSAV